MSRDVKITLGENIADNKVVVTGGNGVEYDITNAVSAVEVSVKAGQMPHAVLTLPWASGEFLAVSAHVPLSTATALQALGWTPPPDQPVLYDTPAPAAADKVTDTVKEPDGTTTHAPAPRFTPTSPEDARR